MTDLVQHHLAHATRDQLLKEFASRNQATVVFFDAVMPAEGGKLQTSTISVTFGSLTNVYGIICTHAPILQQKIFERISTSYGGMSAQTLGAD